MPIDVGGRSTSGAAGTYICLARSQHERMRRACVRVVAQANLELVPRRRRGGFAVAHVHHHLRERSATRPHTHHTTGKNGRLQHAKQLNQGPLPPREERGHNRIDVVQRGTRHAIFIPSSLSLSRN